MTAYRVTIIHDACTTHDVDAASEADAIDNAMCEAGVSLCHQCSDQVEMGDPIRAACVENLDTGESNIEADPDFEVVQLRARVAKLQAALDEAQQDAARYKWVRNRLFAKHKQSSKGKVRTSLSVGMCRSYFDTPFTPRIDDVQQAETLDAAIDAARASAGGAE